MCSDRSVPSLNFTPQHSNVAKENRSFKRRGFLLRVTAQVKVPHEIKIRLDQARPSRSGSDPVDLEVVSPGDQRDEGSSSPGVEL